MRARVSPFLLATSRHDVFRIVKIYALRRRRARAGSFLFYILITFKTFFFFTPAVATPCEGRHTCVYISFDIKHTSKTYRHTQQHCTYADRGWRTTNGRGERQSSMIFAQHDLWKTSRCTAGHGGSTGTGRGSSSDVRVGIQSLLSFGRHTNFRNVVLNLNVIL